MDGNQSHDVTTAGEIDARTALTPVVEQT